MPIKRNQLRSEASEQQAPNPAITDGFLSYDPEAGVIFTILRDQIGGIEFNHDNTGLIYATKPQGFPVGLTVPNGTGRSAKREDGYILTEMQADDSTIEIYCIDSDGNDSDDLFTGDGAYICIAVYQEPT